MAFDRRSFLKFIAGGAIGTLITPFPWKIADDISIWTQNWPWIPQVPRGSISEKTSIVKSGGPEYGIKVKMVNNAPILTSGNPDHWLSEGGLDPIGASYVTLLYSPSRIKGPLKRKKDGTFVPISWKEGWNCLIEKIKGVKGEEVAVISGDESGSSSEVFGMFLKKLGSDNLYYMPSERIVYTRVWIKLLNGQGQIGFDLENCDLILALGADILGSWGCVVKNLKVFSRKNLKIIYVGPYKNQTAILANKWIPLKENDIAKFIFCILYRLIKKGITPPSEILGFNSFKKYILKNYDPEKVLPTIGVSKKDFDYVISTILKNKKSVTIAGSSAQQGGSHINVFAGICMNIIFDRLNKKGGIRCIPPSPLVLEEWDLNLIEGKDLISDFISFNIYQKTIPKILFIYEANPYYSLPQKKELLDTFNKIPFKVSFSPFMDETARMCDLILPAPHPLERMDDSFSPFGVWKATYTIAKPVRSPLMNCQQTPDLIIKMMKDLGIKSRLKDFSSLLKAKSELLGANWNNLLKGKVWSSSTVVYPLGIRIWNSKIKKLCNSYLHTNQSKEELFLTPLKDLRLGTSITGILPYGLLSLREDELDKDGGMFVKINPTTATKFGIKKGSKIVIIGKNGKIIAKAVLDSSVVDGTIGLMMGLGRNGWDEFNRGKGDNVAKLFSLAKEEGINTYCWGISSVKLVKL